MHVSRTTVRRLIKEDLRYKPHVQKISPKLTERHEVKKKSYGLCIRKNIPQLTTEEILFSDEKYFDVDEIYNTFNQWSLEKWQLVPPDISKIFYCRIERRQKIVGRWYFFNF